MLLSSSFLSRSSSRTMRTMLVLLLGGLLLLMISSTMTTMAVEAKPFAQYMAEYVSNMLTPVVEETEEVPPVMTMEQREQEYERELERERELEQERARMPIQVHVERSSDDHGGHDDDHGGHDDDHHDDGDNDSSSIHGASPLASFTQRSRAHHERIQRHLRQRLHRLHQRQHHSHHRRRHHRNENDVEDDHDEDGHDENGKQEHISIRVAKRKTVTSSRVGADACDGSDYGTAGQFDFYVLSQSWPAEFCYSHKSYPGCESPTAWMKTNLTLHGLWPQYAASQNGHAYPQCCPSQWSTELNQTTVSPLLPQLQTYWPNEADPTGGDLTDSLWEHEWAKHGTCTGLDPTTFLQTAMTWSIQPALATPSLISGNAGGTVSRAKLEAVYNGGSGCSGSSCMVALACTDKKYLAEVRTCWTLKGAQMACPSIVMTESDVCTVETLSITAF